MMISSERPQSERGSARLNQRRWLSPAAASRRDAMARAGNSPRRLRALSIGLEDIACSSHRLQIAREFRIALDLAPEPRHLHIDGAQIAAALRLLRQILARDRFARLLRERVEQRRLGGRQMHWLAAAIKQAALQIEAAGAETQLLDALGLLRGALQDVADAQDELARLERLRQIIIGAALEPVDALLGLGHRRQQQDRHGARLA